MMLTRRQVFFDSVLLLCATAGLSGTLLSWSDNPVRILGGLSLSMFMPGYALLRALYPRVLSGLERYTLSITVSFVLAVLIGAALDMTPVGLSGSAIIVLLWLASVTMLAISYIRSFRAERVPLTPVRARRSSLPVGVGAVILSVVLVEAAMVWAGASLFQASKAAPKPFTALSVDGANGVQPTRVPLSVTLDNEEGQSMQYDLEVNVGGTAIARVDGVQLDSGKQYSLQLPVVPADDTAGADVIAYRSGEATPYRMVHVGPASTP